MGRNALKNYAGATKGRTRLHQPRAEDLTLYRSHLRGAPYCERLVVCKKKLSSIVINIRGIT
jgi:hypothetical protein